MKIKTSVLAGPALNWAAATADGWTPVGQFYPELAVKAAQPTTPWADLRYSTDLALGSSVIFRKRIHLCPIVLNGREAWQCWIDGMADRSNDESPLVAAMRCHVRSELGDVFDLPDELLAEFGLLVPNDSERHDLADDERPRG